MCGGAPAAPGSPWGPPSPAALQRGPRLAQSPWQLGYCARCASCSEGPSHPPSARVAAVAETRRRPASGAPARGGPARAVSWAQPSQELPGSCRQLSSWSLAMGCEPPRAGAAPRSCGLQPCFPAGGYFFTGSKLMNSPFLFRPGGALEKFEISGGRGSLPA